MKIVFIGMMGSGKSVIGKRVAQILKLDFIDTDNYIEQNYQKIEDIFKTQGEKKFREIEKEAVFALKDRENTVISTGGGVILDSENMAALKKNAVTVFLNAGPQTLYERTKNSNRPLLKSGGIEKIKDILAKRYPIYEKCADINLQNDNLTIEESAQKAAELILEKLKL